MTYLYLATNLVLLAFNLYAWHNAEPSDPWYCSRVFHGVFAVLFAVFTVRDVLQLL